MSSSHRRYPIFVFICTFLSILACGYTSGGFGQNNSLKLAYWDLNKPSAFEINQPITFSLTLELQGELGSAEYFLLTFSAAATQLTDSNRYPRDCTTNSAGMISCSYEIRSMGKHTLTFNVQNPTGPTQLYYRALLQIAGSVTPDGQPLPMNRMYWEEGTLRPNTYAPLQVWRGDQRLQTATTYQFPQGRFPLTLRNTGAEPFRLVSLTIGGGGSDIDNIFRIIPVNEEHQLNLTCTGPADLQQNLLIEVESLTEGFRQRWYIGFYCAGSPSQVAVSRNGQAIPEGSQVSINPGLTQFTIQLQNETPASLSGVQLDSGDPTLLSASSVEGVILDSSNPQTTFSITCNTGAGLPSTRQASFFHNHQPFSFSVTCQPSTINEETGLDPIGQAPSDAPTGDASIDRLPPRTNDSPPNAGQGFILSVQTCIIVGGGLEFGVLTTLPVGTPVSASVGGVGASGVILDGTGLVSGSVILPAGTYTISIGAAGIGNDSISAVCS